MPPLTLELRRPPAAGIVTRFARAAASPAGTPLGNGLRQAGELYMREQRVAFTRNAAGGGAWRDHRPATKERRGAKVGVPAARARQTRFPLLIDGQDLLKSLIPGGRNNVAEFIPGGYRVGTRDPKARFHQHGTANMVARRILNPPTPATVARMGRVIGDAAMATLRQMKA